MGLRRSASFFFFDGIVCYFFRIQSLRNSSERYKRNKRTSTTMRRFKTDLNRAFLRVHWLGYIDLSKRRVSATDIVKCEERYNKSKAVHSIMSTVAKKENKDLEVLYEQLAWPLYAKYGHAYDAFKAALKYVLLIVCASKGYSGHSCFVHNDSGITHRGY